MEENPLAEYQNQNLKDIIGSLSVVQGVAKDSGNTYYCIQLDLVNGFQKRIYLNSSDRFGWLNAIEQLQSTKQVSL